MRPYLYIISALIAFLIPYAAFAAPPAGVTGISAELQDEAISVSWDPIPDETIAYYRVYFSQQSILGSDGAYDDFEVTSGPVNTYVIEMLPPVETLYIAVLAVNEDGEESEVFLEEASVTLVEEVVIEKKPVEQPKLKVVEKEMEVEVQEEEVVVEEQPEPVEEEVVVEEQPEPVEEEEVEEEAKEEPEVVEVATMEKEEPELAAPQPVTAVSPTTPQPTVAVPTAPPTPTRDVTKPLDVANLMLRAQQQPNGFYTVTAEWQYDNSAGDLAYYAVSQSRDKGASFGEPQTLPIDIKGVQLQDVDPGDFGLAVQTVNIYGYPSHGVFQSIELPGGPAAPPTIVAQPVTATVAQPPQVEVRAVQLTQTGGGILLAMIFAGGIAVLGKLRKRNSY